LKRAVNPTASVIFNMSYLVCLKRAVNPTASVIFNMLCVMLQAADSTVFFFDISKNFAPIGFVTAPSPVTCVSWATSKIVSYCSSSINLQFVIQRLNF
jgi:hypothetical protein